MRYFNISSLETYRECEQEYQYRYSDGIVPSGKSSALEFGTAIHRGIEALYLPSRLSDSLTAQKNGSFVTKNAWVPAFDTELALERFHLAMNEVEEDENTKEVETRAYGEELLKAYFKRYATDKLLFSRVLGLELELHGPVTSKFGVAGRLDMIAELSGPGSGWWHVQHKTLNAQANVEAYVKQIHMSWHERAYKLLARQAGVEIKGSFINILRKLVLPKKMSTEWNPFYRERLPISDEHVERFTLDFEDICFRVEDSEKRNTWPQNSKSCTRWNKICPYYQCCMNEIYPSKVDGFVQAEETYVDKLNRKEGLNASK